MYMPHKKYRHAVTVADTGDWLKKAVHSAPRPLPEGFFPRILQHSMQEGFSREDLLNILDIWLNYGYCRLIDPIMQDITITPEGERYFYG
jgi:hypothetical protein